MYQDLKAIMTFLCSRQKKKKYVVGLAILCRQYLYSFVFASYFSGGSNSKQIRGWQKRACTTQNRAPCKYVVHIAKYQSIIIGLLPT